MKREQFVKVIAEALDSLPQEFRSRNVAFRVPTHPGLPATVGQSSQRRDTLWMWMIIGVWIGRFMPYLLGDRERSEFAQHPSYHGDGGFNGTAVEWPHAMGVFVT